MTDQVRGSEPPTKEVHRYQVDVVVIADSREQADKAITIRGPHLIRAVTWSVIRDKHGTNPAWRITQEGDTMTIEPKRKRARG